MVRGGDYTFSPWHVRIFIVRGAADTHTHTHARARARTRDGKQYSQPKGRKSSLLGWCAAISCGVFAARETTFALCVCPSVRPSVPLFSAARDAPISISKGSKEIVRARVLVCVWEKRYLSYATTQMITEGNADHFFGVVLSCKRKWSKKIMSLQYNNTGIFLYFEKRCCSLVQCSSFFPFYEDKPVKGVQENNVKV